MRSTSFRAGFICGAAFVALCLAVFVVAKAQVSVSILGVSKHSESGYCEMNPGYGLAYRVAPSLRIGGMRYLNSLCRWSNAFGLIYEPLQWGDFRFGTALLRVSGYRAQPVLAPLPVGSYHVAGPHYVDFFAIKNHDLAVAGAAWRIEW